MHVPATLGLVALCAAHARANYDQSTCDWTDTTFHATGCGTPNDGICETGTPCSDDCSDCYTASGGTLIKSTLSCSDCVAAGGFWCETESLCLPTDKQPDALWSAAYKLRCEGTWTNTCPTYDFPYDAKLFSAQNWVYDLVNVKPAWAAGYTGKGVHIRVNDDGMDVEHPDFASKFRADLSCEKHTAHNLEKDSHGTTCAAIAAASAESKECSVGIAHEAELSSCRIAVSDADIITPESQDDAYLTLHLDSIDVSSNSWGIDPCTKKSFAGRRAGQELALACPFQNAEMCSYLEIFCKWGSDFDRTDKGCQTAISGICTQHYEEEKAACDDFLDMFIYSCTYNTVSETGKAQLIKAVKDGRNGKGVVFVFSAGNEHTNGEHVGMEGWLNNRMTITVGSTGKHGGHASYSTPGAALFISAPGGDFEFPHNHVTATSSALAQCHSAGVGTSYACPVVTGVVALMLQANPELTWRDVQGVLQASANTTVPAMAKTGPAGEKWVTNGAGVKHHLLYGFGMVDAMKAVEMAKTWTMWGKEEMLIVESGTVDLAIPDDGEKMVESVAEFAPAPGKNHKLESLVVYLSIEHPARGDLEVRLVSPAGTSALLSPGKRPENTQSTEMWKLLDLVHWGESPAGKWKLQITDKVKGERPFASCADQPWEFTHEDILFSCSNVANYGICSSGGAGTAWEQETEFMGTFQEWLAQSADQSGMHAGTACCVCGGGVVSDISGIKETLKSWQILMYTHEHTPATPLPPTPNPAPALNVTDSATVMLPGLLPAAVAVVFLLLHV